MDVWFMPQPVNDIFLRKVLDLLYDLCVAPVLPQQRQHVSPGLVLVVEVETILYDGVDPLVEPLDEPQVAMTARVHERIIAMVVNQSRISAAVKYVLQHPAVRMPRNTRERGFGERH